jgi:hypothetical protein
VALVDAAVAALLLLAATNLIRVATLHYKLLAMSFMRFQAVMSVLRLVNWN